MCLISKIKPLFLNKLCRPNRYYYLTYRPKIMSVTSQNELGQKILISTHRIEKYRNSLKNFGFTEFQAQRILETEPEILSTKIEHLSLCLTNWYSLKIIECDLLKAISSCPKLLRLNPEIQEARINQLMTVFTQKDLVKLFKTCPEAYIDDFETLMEKVEYIVVNMGVEQPSIIKSKALHSNIREIKLRHYFLLLSGKFKKPKPRMPYSNAPLHQILHKNINVFLKLSKLTMEEYEAFVSMFDQLMMEQNDDYDSDESDDDDDK